MSKEQLSVRGAGAAGPGGAPWLSHAAHLVREGGFKNEKELVEQWRDDVVAILE